MDTPAHHADTALTSHLHAALAAYYGAGQTTHDQLRTLLAHLSECEKLTLSEILAEAGAESPG